MDRHVRPVGLKHGLAETIFFALEYNIHTHVFKREIKAADPSKEGCDP